VDLADLKKIDREIKKEVRLGFLGWGRGWEAI
jgi:hypothetical protein